MSSTNNQIISLVYSYNIYVFNIGKTCITCFIYLFFFVTFSNLAHNWSGIGIVAFVRIVFLGPLGGSGVAGGKLKQYEKRIV